MSKKGIKYRTDHIFTIILYDSKFIALIACQKISEIVKKYTKITINTDLITDLHAKIKSFHNN